MNNFVDRFKKRKDEFGRAYDEKDHTIDHYAPYFYKRMSAQLKQLDIKLPTDAVNELVAKPSLKYVINFNWGHRMMHEMHSPDENEMNAREKRYHEVQYAESLAWLVIKMTDDIVDDPNSLKSTPSIVNNYINSIVYESNKNPPLPPEIPEAKLLALNAAANCLREQLVSLDALDKFKTISDSLSAAWQAESSCATMTEYREAKRNVSLESANLALFFITGAGDKKYEERYFGKNNSIKDTMNFLAVAGNYFDSFTDFNEDKEGPIKHLAPTLSDRMWFLYAAMKEISENIPNFNAKQSTHLSAMAANLSVSLTKGAVSGSSREKRTRQYQEIIDNSKDLFLENPTQNIS